MGILRTSWEILVQLSPWMLLGMVLSGLMHVLLPRNFIRRKFQGTRGVINAVMLGVPLPLCSCGVVPAGIGLKNDGASDGASVGFLISTPQTGVDSILVSAGFFGWPFAFFKMFAAAITGILGGLLADTGHIADDSGQENAIESNDHEHAHTDSGPGHTDGLRVKFVDAWNHGAEVVRSVWVWLLVGILVSALIQDAVPATWIQSVSDFGLLPAMLLVLLISVPLYVCATASVPIAAGLVAAGMPPAVAIVFLMAGSATNVTTIAAVYGRFGWRTLTIYLSTIIVGSMLFAWIFDWVISSGPATSAVAAEHHHHQGWFAISCAVAMLFLIASFIREDVLQRMSRRRMAESTEQGLELNVTGMHCSSCVSRIESALKKLNGVDGVAIELKSGLATVSGKVERAEIERTITGLGFTVEPSPSS